MCTIVGGAVKVVDADGFVIEELAGNVASSDDTISIAYVKAAAGTCEPWLTLHYDEWWVRTRARARFASSVSRSDRAAAAPAGSA